MRTICGARLQNIEQNQGSTLRLALDTATFILQIK